MVFKRISSSVNPFAQKLFDYPGIIYPCFDIENDKSEFVRKIASYDRDIFAEYGSGSGNHLIEIARRVPETLCVGFEIRFKRAVRTIEKAHAKNVHNLIIFRNRGEYLPDIFEKSRLSGIYINFPDPWDKKRWLKHRVLTKAVIDEFILYIKKDGFISIKTDHSDYFRDFLGEFNGTSGELPYEFVYTTQDLHTDLKKEENNFLSDFNADVKSEFEKLFESQNKPICYALIKPKTVQAA